MDERNVLPVTRVARGKVMMIALGETSCTRPPVGFVKMRVNVKRGELERELNSSLVRVTLRKMYMLVKPPEVFLREAKSMLKQERARKKRVLLPNIGRRVIQKGKKCQNLDSKLFGVSRTPYPDKSVKVSELTSGGGS